jgi:ABC-type multidrug transport system fused ATPase/permease subunit
MHAPLAEQRRMLAIYLRPQVGRVLSLTLLVLVGIALQLLNPQILAAFIDATQRSADQAALIAAGLLYLVVGLAQHGVRLAAVAVSLTVGWRAANALRADLLRHLLRLDMSFHKAHTPGELIERADGDVGSLGSFFAEFLVRTAANGLLIVGILVLVFRIDALAGGALLIFTFLTLLLIAVAHRLGAARWHAARIAWSEQMGFIEENYAGTEDLRGVGAEQYVLRRLFILMRSLTEKARAGWMAQALAFAAANFLYALGYGLGLALGAYLYIQGQATIGAAFMLVFYVGMLAEPLDALRSQGNILQQASASVRRIDDLLRLQPQTARSGVQVSVSPSGPLAVEFDGVDFTYSDAEAAQGDASTSTTDVAGRETVRTLRDITLRLPPGRVLGLLGRTGSGKTTLTRLLLRLYDPGAGVIRLGGVDLRSLNLNEVRRRVGVVTQDVQLFQATLRDNITFFDRAVNDAAVEAALAELGLLDWARAMPAGLNTVLGAGSQGLSAGEAQLLAFTRLLLRDPGLVILDEAAARLDPITERRLERAIDRLLVNRSAVIIAHRLHTVQRADDILILEAGRVVEYGARVELAANPASRFSRLLRTGLEEALA